MMDEQGLIRASLGGDLNAFNQLVLKYQDLVYYQAYGYMQNREAAEDAAQDAFILAFQKLKTYRGGSFKAWLLRIVSHLCIDELRRWKRRPLVALNPLADDDEEIESPYWLSDEGPSPEEKAEQAELHRSIDRYLKELPVEYRSVVYLVDVLALDYNEAADALNVPVGTIKSRLARGRRQLRSRLKPLLDPVPAGQFAGGSL